MPAPAPRILPVGEFLPDHPALGNSGLTVARNVVPLSRESYGPIPALQSVGIAPISDLPVLGVFTFVDAQEVEHVFVGTATRLWHLQTGDTVFADVSRQHDDGAPVLYNASITNPWVFCSFGPSVIAVNGVDPPQTFLPGEDENFSNLADPKPAEPATDTTSYKPPENGAPVGRFCATVRNWLMIGNLNEGGIIQPTMLRWSAIGAPQYWPLTGTLEAAVSQSDFNELPSGLGAIRGIASGLQAADALILADNGAVTVAFTGSPTTFGFTLAQGSAGCRCSSSIVTNRGICYYLGQDGFYQHSGVQGQSISASRVDRWFFNDPENGVDPAFVTLTQGAVDTSGRLILWLYPSKNSNGTLDRMIIFNFMLDRWSFAKVSAQWASKGSTFGYSVDQLDPFGMVDFIQIGFDSPYWRGGAPALYVFDAAGKLSTFSGDPLPARIETGEYQFVPGMRSRLTNSRALIDNGLGLVSVGTRNRLLDPVIWSPPVAPNYHGENPQRCDSRYMTIRLDIPPLYLMSEFAQADDDVSIGVPLNAAGLGTPHVDSPFSLWHRLHYDEDDLEDFDYFTEPQLDPIKWNPYLGGDFFGSDDPQARFIGQPPNSQEPSIPWGATSGVGPTNARSMWTLWHFDEEPENSPIPSFDSEIFSAYPAGDDLDEFGGATPLVTGPGTAYPGGGLAITASRTNKPAYEFGMADIYGALVRIRAGSNRVTISDDIIEFTATTSDATAPGSQVLHFAGGVPPGLVRGLWVNNLTHTTPDYIANGGSGQNNAPCAVDSFTATSVTLTFPTGSAGVPAGDLIRFQTGAIHKLMDDCCYYIIGTGIPDDTWFRFNDTAAEMVMTKSATVDNDNAVVRLSRFGWVSAYISGSGAHGFHWPAGGGYLQWRSKYPDSSFGANAQVDFYPVDNSGLPDFSFESGYNEFSTVGANQQFLVGFFNGTNFGIITPEPMNLGFHTFGMENWPDVAFTIFADGKYCWSNAACVLSGEITGSTLTVSDVMPIAGGEMAVDHWLHYPGSSQTLYLQDGAGSTWTIFDHATGNPAILSVPAGTTMGISYNTIAGPHTNMHGSCTILFGQTMMVGAQGFHTLADFDQPGPYQWLISGVERYKFPRQYHGDLFEHALAMDVLDPIITNYLIDHQEAAAAVDAPDRTLLTNVPDFQEAASAVDAPDATITPALQLDFNFETGSYFQFGRGTSISSLITCNRASVGYADDTSGNWTSFANNIPRITNKGLLVEETRINSIRNNSMQGAVAGSPGTLPTNWGHTLSGLVETIIGVGTENGVDYIDVRCTGTASPGFYRLLLEGIANISAASGQTWSASYFYKFLSAPTNVTGVRGLIFGYTSGGAIVETFTQSAITTLPTTLGRSSYAATFANATTSFARPGIDVLVNTGTAVDFTIRVGWPQLELGAFATSPIRTTTVAMTRLTDITAVTTAPDFGSAYTLFGKGSPASPITNASNQRLITVDDGSITNIGTVQRNANNGIASGSATLAGVSTSLNTGLVWALGASGKAAFGSIAGSQAVSFNGSAVTTAAVSQPGSLIAIRIGSNSTNSAKWSGYIERIMVWPTYRATNAELQALTT